MTEEQLQEIMTLMRENLRPSIAARLIRDLGLFILVFGVLAGGYLIYHGSVLAGTLGLLLTALAYANTFVLNYYMERG